MFNLLKTAVISIGKIEEEDVILKAQELPEGKQTLYFGEDFASIDIAINGNEIIVYPQSAKGDPDSFHFYGCGNVGETQSLAEYSVVEIKYAFHEDLDGNEFIVLQVFSDDKDPLQFGWHIGWYKQDQKPKVFSLTD